MKAIIYFTMAVALLVTGCHKPSPAPVPGPEQYDRYIFFSQKVDTKAELIESASSVDQFGVVGFKYDNTTDWNTCKTGSITPNVFYDEAGKPLDGAETVYCDDNGYGEYSPLQGWSNTKKYTFFAYYPLDKTSLVNTDGKAYTSGIPAIRYEMNAADLKGSMRDVMTAASTPDLYWNSTSDNNVTNAEVAFNFTHRLSCLGVRVKNSSSGNITLTSVTLKLSGISYQEIVIPLDGSAGDGDADGTSMDAELALTLADSDKSITKAGEKEVSDKLIFIPQTSELSAQVVIGYKRENTDEYTGYTDTMTLPAVTTVLTEGKKHLINLNFTDSTVGVQVTTDGWVDMDDVYDTFN